MSTDTTPDDAAAPGSADPAYAFKPSLIGAPSLFVLRPDALHFQIGRYSGRARYDRISKVRISFRPATMQTHRFVTEIWSPDAPKVQIASTSWRSVVEQERHDADYAGFIRELHRRMAAAGSSAQCMAGMPAIAYWIGVAVFGAAFVAMAIMAVKAVQLREWTGAAIIGALFVVFGYQLIHFFRRNWPSRYRADAVPDYALPGA